MSTGGAEKLIVETIPLLNEESGLTADLALLNANEQPFYSELRNKNDGFIIYELSKKSVYNPFLIFKIIPLLKKYDLLHVHLFPSQYWTVFARILSFSKIPLVFTEHSTNNRRLSNPKFKLIDKLIYKFYSKIICISPEVKNKLITSLAIPQDKLIVLRNGINLKEIKSARTYHKLNFGFSDKDVLIVKVAGFRIEKDHETLLNTLKELPENYKLLLVGDGAKRGEIEVAISRLQLNNRVKLLGVRSDVSSILKMCDISVLSSHWEGFGMAAAESMAAGIPVIASNVDGLAQVVEGGGLLFEKGDINDLKSKIIQIAENADLRKKLIDSGFAKSSQYSISEMVNNLQDLYKEVV